MTEKQKKALTIAGFIIFLAVMGLVTWFVGRPLISFAKEPEKFREWVNGFGVWGKLIFVGLIVLQIIVAFIPGEPFEIVAGYAFGTFWGTLLCVVGEVIGSVLVFLFVRKCGIRAIEVFFPREKIDSLRFMRDEKKVETFAFIAFLIPGTPKDILSYCAGITHMKLSTWVFISTVARFPSVITSTVGGDALGMGQHLFAVIVFVVTIALSLVGLYFYNRAVKRRAEKYAETHKA